MTYKPCYGCHLRDGCEQRAEKQKALRGLGLRMVDWKCDKKLSGVVMGSVVMFDWRYYDGCGNNQIRNLIGIVMRWKDERRLWVYVDQAQISDVDDFGLPMSQVIPLLPTRLTFTGERVKVCRYCGHPEGVERIKIKSKDTTQGGQPVMNDWHCRDGYNDNGEWGKEYYELDCVYV